MTLEYVKVNLEKAFEPSQVYVACTCTPVRIHRVQPTNAQVVSRAHSLDGLHVTALPSSDLLSRCDEEVKEFYQKRFSISAPSNTKKMTDFFKPKPKAVAER
jgi:hypothetical protein